MSDRPFVGPSVANRLRKYLREAGLDEGETPHSFRRGLSNTLRLLGCSPEDIARYVGWSGSAMAEHYTSASQASSVLSLFTNFTQSLSSSHPPQSISHPGNLRALKD